MRIVFLVSIVFLFIHQAVGQGSVSANFIFPSQPYDVCLQQPLEIENTSQNALEYLWDFCPEAFTESPTISASISVPGLSNGWSYKIVKHSNEWTGFLLSRNTNTLFRLEFGDDPSNTPQIVDLGNPGNLLISPQGLDIVNLNGSWFGFVGKGETTTGQIVRLDFGTDLHNTPAAVGLGTFGTSGRRLRDVKVITQNSDWVLLVILDGDNALLRINYRESLNNAIAAENISSTGALAQANLPLGFSIVRHLGNWIVHTVSFSNNGVQQYNFGTDIFGVPVFEGNFTFSSVARPYYIKLIREADSYYGFIGNESKNLSIIKFGDFTSPPQELPNSIIPRFIGFDVIKSHSRNIIQGSVTGTATLRHVTFENVSCAVTPAFSDGQTPSDVTFHGTGAYTIELMASGANPLPDVFSKSLTVTGQTAPSIQIVSEKVCVGAPVSFSVNSDHDLKAWNWHFGDATTSIASSPLHAYGSPGDYLVEVRITDTNDCSNRQTYPLSMYPAPVAEFELAPGLICTNNQFLFPTTTPDIYDGNLSYQWFVEGNPVSTDRDLQHNFSTTGPKEIRLVTSIPGCSDEITKTTSSVAAGPVVDFTYTGTCEDEIFSFQQQISDPVESYHWDFGGTGTSPNPTPSYTFADYGDFQVSLAATNAAGCNNIQTKTVAVHAKPVTDFSLAPPPNACSGTNTVFQNETLNPDGRQITGWLWDFGGTIQTGSEGHHIFPQGGTYNISLVATTAAGCSGTAEKSITILQSPATDIAFTAACDDVPVLFTGPPDTDIRAWYWEIGTSYYDTPSPTHTFKSPGDYPLYLEVAALNNCVSTLTRTIHVPLPLIPNFTSIRNCVGQEAVLTDITSGEDPVASREWSLNGVDVSTASSFIHTFFQERNEQVSLKVTTAAGCSYELTRMVDILPSPVAEFSSRPSQGAYPLDVVFINTSTFATQYLWEFWPGATSMEPSPQVTFEEQGTFQVKLTAFNDQQCEDSFEAAIVTVDPLPDADIEMINLVPNEDGSMKLIVTIHNKGNTVLKALPIDLDFSGSLSLRKIADEPILPAAKFNYVLNTDILNPEALRYLCIAIDVPNDVAPSGNRMCEEFGHKLFAFPAFPNPAAGSLNVEWILAVGKTVRISLVDALGKTISTQQLAASPGLNRQIIDVSGLENGLYILLIDDGVTKNTQHIAVGNKL